MSYSINTSFALSNFSAKDIENLKKLVAQDFLKIQSIDPEKPDYKRLPFRKEEISAIQRKLQQNNAENLSAKLWLVRQHHLKNLIFKVQTFQRLWLLTD